MFLLQPDTGNKLVHQSREAALPPVCSVLGLNKFWSYVDASIPPPNNVQVQKGDRLIFGGPVWPQSVPLLPVFCDSMFVVVEVFPLLSGCCVNAETHS